MKNFENNNLLMTLAPYLKPHINLEIQEKIDIVQLIYACEGKNDG